MAHERPEWYSLTERPGWMRLYVEQCPSEKGNLYYAGNLYLQKFPAPEFTVTTVVEPSFEAVGERAGLLTMGDEYSYIAVVAGENGKQRVAVVTGKNDKLAVTPRERASTETGASKVWLRCEYLPDDLCRYSYSTDGETFTPLGKPCHVAQGTWVGAKTGIFASSLIQVIRGE